MPVSLNFRAFGDDGPAMIILHGLFGSAANWGAIAKRFAMRYRVYVLDLRNHGDSPWNDEHSYLAMAEDVSAFMDEQGIEQATVLGHSMGGKVAMTVALQKPERVQRLIVADIAPVQYRHRFDDVLTPMQNLNLAQVNSRGDADKALSADLADPGLRAFILHNLRRDGDRWEWRINLAVLSESIDEVTGFPEFAPSVAYNGASLFIHGSASDYVREKHHETIAARFPDHRLHTLQGAGHWLHAEQPAAFIEAVEAFIGTD